MKKIVQIAMILFLVFVKIDTLYAQSKIRGSVIDANGKPIIAATVLLLNSADSVLVKGTIANNSGNYSFDNIAAGKYFITSSYVGFSPVSTTLFQVLSNNETIDQDVLKLEPVPSALTNVTVTAKRPLYEQKSDRLVINVESSITSSGNTALEVLERSPGVSVNRQNNTIAILGKDGVNVMINGKLSYMPASAIVQMLDGMSAGNIEKIELITTPPANLDAEGKAGYINIVLKQNDNIGTNGSFSGTLGYGKGWVTGANLNFNHRKGKANIYEDFSYSRTRSLFTSSGYTRISNSGNIYETYTHNDRTDTVRFHNARLGMDYQFSSRTVLGILFTSNGRWFRQAEHTTSSFYKNSNPDTLFTGTNTELNNWQDYSINLNLQHNLAKGDNIFFNVSYLHYKNNQPFNYYSQYYNKAGTFIYDETTRNGKLTPLNFWISGLDYSKKLSEKINLEAGIKGTIADFTNELNFERLVQGNWAKDASLSSIYTLKENYSAAYISLSVVANEKTTLKGGLRYEYTNTNLGSESQKNIVDRHYGKLFPNFSLSHKLNEKNTVNFSYSMRITRPKFNDLAPFTYYVNRNFLLTGNSGLQPAIAHAISAGYTFKKYFLQVSFTKEDDATAFFQPTVDSAANKTIAKPENLVNQKLVSAVLSVPVTVAKWWSMQYNITGTWQQVNALYKNEQVKIEQKNININMRQVFTLPKNFSIELSGFYQSKQLNGITVFKSLGTLDFGLRKKLGAKDAINFSVNNLLNSMDFRGNNNLPEQNLVGDSRLRFSWRTFKATYTRSFGKDKLKRIRNRATGSEDEKSRIQY